LPKEFFPEAIATRASGQQGVIPVEPTSGEAQADKTTAVSFPDEQLVLVDADDRVVGYRSKLDAHRGAGQRHRAFSVFLFDSLGRLLVHRRSGHKPLWPGFWTNSCCSHPRRGESLDASVKRRLREELGSTPSLTRYASRFEYHARYGDAGSEHELCHIYLARHGAGASLTVHPQEVAEIRWMPGDEVDVFMREDRDDLTPWFRLEWALLRERHPELLRAFLQPEDHLDVA
jgi:isopentenyl-diphosphate delta-isomerase